MTTMVKPTREITPAASIPLPHTPHNYEFSALGWWWLVTGRDTDGTLSIKPIRPTNKSIKIANGGYTHSQR